MRAEAEQITVARTKQHEEEEEDTYIRPAGRGKGNKERSKKKTTKQTSKTTSDITAAFALPPLNTTKTNKVETTTHCRVRAITIPLQYYYYTILLQYSYNTIAMLLQYDYNTITILLKY